MLVLRLTRVGKKKEPSYRIILQEKGRDPWAKALEILGNYNPRSKKLTVLADRVTHWIKQGAQPSPTLNNLLVGQKIIDRPKIKVTASGTKKPEQKTA